MERIGVLVHPVRPVQKALDVLREWTHRHGLELVQIPAGEQPSVAPEGEVTACDLVTALGGDGTVLKALHVAARTRTPVMGVAYGSLGALTAVPETELISGLDRFAAGDWLARRLPALCLATSEGELAWALNDIVLTRRGGTQLVVDLSVGDELYVRVAGDGMIVATPLGSSAYSMAAGGPLLSVDSEAFVCTPLAMHGGSAPPLVVPSDSEVTLEAHPGHDGFELNVDGFQVQSNVERFVVTAVPHYSTLVAMDGIVTGVTGLRERGLVSDSPRLLGRDERDERDERTVSTRAG
jgi:NAD+ kinase